MPASRHVLALGFIALVAGTVASATAAATARREAREASRRLDLFRQWVDADEAFIDGDRERALVIYAGLAEATGDSSLLRQRFAFDSSERSDGDTPASATRDYARLAARLERTEALLDELRTQQQGDDDGLFETVQELERTIDRQLAEIGRLRAEVERGRARGLLRFQAEKGAEVVYIGDTREGRAHGVGYGLWSTGSVYEGEWAGNRRHGRGVFRWKDGESYEGEYREDRRAGRGSYIFKSGERWEGEWLDDMRHGEGVLYDAKGKVRVNGRWAQDKLVETFKN
jgi:hypothetical protein